VRTTAIPSILRSGVRLKGDNATDSCRCRFGHGRSVFEVIGGIE
jgi:hypothetical protein